MGNGRWMKVLRYTVSLAAVLLLLAYLAPKACLPLGWFPNGQRENHDLTDQG